MIKLQRYVENKHNLELISNYSLENPMFTAHPLKVIEASRNDGNRFPIMIFKDFDLVGFFCLHRLDGVFPYGGTERDILLRAFSIDERFRNQSIAFKSMMELDSFIGSEFNTIDSVILAVNHANDPALNLYKKVGFVDTGKRKDGKLGVQFILEKQISSR